MALPGELLSNGMVFIWGAKTNIGQLMDHFESMGYAYAENFAFVLLSKSKIPAPGFRKVNGNKSILNFFSRNPLEKPMQEKRGIKIEEGEYDLGRVTDPSEVFVNG
ncbi:unnamed protein product [Sphagnum balticum]